MGVVGIKVTEARGEVVGTLVVDDDDEILAMTSAGVLISTGARSISLQGRSASGVKVMSPDDDDHVASIALVSPAVEDDDAADGIDGSAEPDPTVSDPTVSGETEQDEPDPS